jgi:adenosylcobinamide-GDP ribazoletransferase
MKANRGPFSDFVIATAILTRLPVGATRTAGGGIAAAGWAFPLVGAGVGALSAVAYFVAQALGLSIAAAALLAVLAAVAVTGAFHEDGLADTVDGFGGGRTREAKLAIMRDSRHGTFGILALVLGIGLRAAALAAIGDPIHVGLALIAAHAVSRGALPPLMRLLPPARADGLGAAAGRPSLAVAVVAALLGAAIGVAVLGPGAGGIAVLLTAAALALAAILARRQVGGYTGDVLGFFQQIGEIMMLLAAAAK